MIQEFIDPFTLRCDIFFINEKERGITDRKMLEQFGLRAGTDYYWRGDDMIIISGKCNDKFYELLLETKETLGWKKLPKRKSLFGHNIKNF
jgi:hypothetical protein